MLNKCSKGGKKKGGPTPTPTLRLGAPSKWLGAEFLPVNQSSQRWWEGVWCVDQARKGGIPEPPIGKKVQEPEGDVQCAVSGDQ